MAYGDTEHKDSWGIRNQKWLQVFGFNEWLPVRAIAEPGNNQASDLSESLVLHICSLGYG